MTTKVYDIDTILRHIKKNKIKFDNPVQRGFVWKKKSKSFLIHSVIVGYPIGTIFANEIGYIIDVFDGQQRLTSISQYANGGFKLSELPPILILNNNNNIDIEDLTVLNFEQLPSTLQKIIENSDGYENNDKFKNKPFKSYSPELKKDIMSCEEVVNISGKNFDDLSEIIKRKFLNYSIDVQSAENLSQNQIATLFDRLNSGKPLTATEKAKAQILSPQAVKRLQAHEIFTTMLSKDEMIGKVADTYVMQTYVALFSEGDKCLLGAKIQTVLSKNEITEEQEATMKSCFDVYLKAVQEVKECNSYVDKKLKSRLKARSHFASLLPVAEMVIKENIDADKFVDWLRYFFATGAGMATMSSEYNSKLNDSANSHPSVLIRINAAKDNFSKYLECPPEKETSNQLTL